jgi:hypothetical protein
MRVKSIAVLGASLVLIPAASASAGTLTTPNVCQYSIYPGFWFDHGIDLAGTAAPNPVAPGTGVNLTGTSARARLPEWVAEYGYNFQVLKPGENTITAKVWIALAADASPQGIQVVTADTVARTTIEVNPDGTYKSSSPLDVTVPLADTQWTAPGGDGTLTFRQGGPGTLPRLPVGGGVTPKGSVFISAKLTDTLGTLIDCQPGTEQPGRETFTAATSGPFESVPVRTGAPVVIPAPPTPTAKKPALTLRTSKLKRAGKRVSLALACADAPCAGTVTAKYAGGTAAKSVKYTLAAGARKTYKLTLSAKALKSLKRKSLLVSVKITTDGGTTVSKKLRLKK